MSCFLGIILPRCERNTAYRRNATSAPVKTEEEAEAVGSGEWEKGGVSWHLMRFFLIFCDSLAVSDDVAMGGHAKEIEMVPRPRG